MAIQTNKTLAIGNTLFGGKNGTVTGQRYNFSETEQPVGIWIDGSTIYQKTYTGTTPSSGSGFTQLATLPSGFDKLIDIEMFANNSTYGQFVANYASSDLLVKTQNDKIYVTVGTYFKSKEYWLTIRYTKTQSEQ